MDSTVFHIGDSIRGTVLGQLDFGITLDHYFSTVAVRLDNGTEIKVCFFQQDGGFGPAQGQTFQAKVGYSIFNKPPFTTNSYFMLENVAVESAHAPARPERPAGRDGPLAWVAGAIRKAVCFDM